MVIDHLLKRTCLLQRFKIPPLDILGQSNLEHFFVGMVRNLARHSVLPGHLCGPQTTFTKDKLEVPLVDRVWSNAEPCGEALRTDRLS